MKRGASETQPSASLSAARLFVDINYEWLPPELYQMRTYWDHTFYHMKPALLPYPNFRCDSFWTRPATFCYVLVCAFASGHWAWTGRDAPGRSQTAGTALMGAVRAEPKWRRRPAVSARLPQLVPAYSSPPMLVAAHHIPPQPAAAHHSPPQSTTARRLPHPSTVHSPPPPVAALPTDHHSPSQLGATGYYS